MHLHYICIKFALNLHYIYKLSERPVVLSNAIFLFQVVQNCRSRYILPPLYKFILCQRLLLCCLQCPVCSPGRHQTWTSLCFQSTRGSFLPRWKQLWLKASLPKSSLTCCCFFNKWRIFEEGETQV